ncbi:MAG: HEAT repeat domain-containing protein, partial [Sterolibacteriaceae bacterium]|nr:HEAT repeat domain-containing protein [Sterolibacteriaceae bacterium]
DLALAAHDPDAVLRDRAVASLGRIGVPAGTVVPALIAALDDPADHVRHAAIVALESLPADQARAALPALRRLAERGSGLDRRARHALARLDGPLPPAGELGALRYMLGGGKRFGSLDYTLLQIARHGPGAASVVPELLPLLAGDDELIRYTAIETLIAIGPGAAAARPALEGIAATGAAPLRQVAQEALATLAGAPR